MLLEFHAGRAGQSGQRFCVIECVDGRGVDRLTFVGKHALGAKLFKCMYEDWEKERQKCTMPCIDSCVISFMLQMLIGKDASTKVELKL
jgi:hypothetical protein